MLGKTPECMLSIINFLAMKLINTYAVFSNILGNVLQNMEDWVPNPGSLFS